MVVTGIIAFLALVVSVSIFSARGKGDDAKRLSDLRALQTALDIYYADHKRYPLLAEFGSGGAAPLVPGYVLVMPLDPRGSRYAYVPCGPVGAPTSYHLGTSFEDAKNEYLGRDSDYFNGAQCPGDFRGLSTNAPSSIVGAVACSSGTDGAPGPGGGETCYDVKR